MNYFDVLQRFRKTDVFRYYHMMLGRNNNWFFLGKQQHSMLPIPDCKSVLEVTHHKYRYYKMIKSLDPQM